MDNNQDGQEAREIKAASDQDPVSANHDPPGGVSDDYVASPAVSPESVVALLSKLDTVATVMLHLTDSLSRQTMVLEVIGKALERYLPAITSGGMGNLFKQWDKENKARVANEERRRNRDRRRGKGV